MIFFLGTGTAGEGVAASVWPPVECPVCHRARALVNIAMTKTGNAVTCWECSEEVNPSKRSA